MANPKYQGVLLQLLSLWELQLAKLEGRRPRTQRRPPARSRTGANMPNAHAMTSELTKSQYLSQRIERAVEPIAALLDETDLRFIKLMLEERLRTDPHLSRLVERAMRRLL